MRDLLLVLFIFGMLPVVLFKPRLGILLWAWISYMNPHRLTWSYAYNFRFNFIVAIATLIGIWFARDIYKRIPWTPTTVLWLLFIGWTSVTTYTAFNTGSANWEWFRFHKIQLMIACTFFLIDDRKWLHYLAWVIAFSIGFWGLKGGFFTLLHGGAHHVYGPAISFISDNNALALALVITVPLMRYLQLHTPNKLIRLVLIVTMALSSAAILGSYSRGGFLGAGVLAVAFWLKNRHKWLLGLVMIIGIGLLLNFMPPKWQERMEDIFKEEEILDDLSVSGRFIAWNFALEVVKDRPLIGTGFRGFSYKTYAIYSPENWARDAHSIYFEVLAEQGIPGLTLFVLMYLFTFQSGRWVIKNTKDRPELIWANDLAAMLQVSLVGYAVAGAFLGLAYFDLPYHFMAMVMITRRIVEKELSLGTTTRTVQKKTEASRSIFSDRTRPFTKPTR
ncbi:MAG: putative O-glycosylation ligase, exosortase A system-associated [Magnetococcales bacterium]|nr:putative O-glycosylation ligase, exosortase A system-associated [Magnetococcales bacterium]